MKTCRVLAVASILASCGALASASEVIFQVNQGQTGSVLHGGDRELIKMGYSGTSDVFTNTNFSLFTTGTISSYDNSSPTGTLSWTAPLSRDMDFSNRYSGNPDRADGASHYLLEGSNQGTLDEVFSDSRFGYKNMSYLIDGEGARDDFAIELFFGGGNSITIDNDDSTVEFSILERGMNSDIAVRGIRSDNTLTDRLFISRDDWGFTGWKLDTLEIGDNQKVGAVGVSLDSSWNTVIGFRLEADRGFNGPDIIAIGSIVPVPAPGSAVLAATGGLLLGSRRRR